MTVFGLTTIGLSELPGISLYEIPNTGLVHSTLQLCYNDEFAALNNKPIEVLLLEGRCWSQMFLLAQVAVDRACLQ